MFFFWIPTDEQDAVQYAYRTCIKQVDCQACATQYYFRMGRMGKGKHQSSFRFVGGKRDLAIASQLAMKNAVKLLEQEAEMVPCPACGHINPELIEGFARRIRLSPTGAWICLWVGLFCSGVIGWLLETQMAPHMGWPWGPASAVALTLGALGPIYGWLIMRFRRRRFIQKYLDLEPDVICQLPMGTPKAMLVDVDDQGQSWLETVITDEVDQITAAQGVIFNNDNVSFPPICCDCMGTVDDTCVLHLPDHSEKVPVCKTCHRRAFMRRIILFMLITVMVIAFYGVMTYLFPPSQPGWLLAIYFPMTVIAALGIIMSRFGWLLIWFASPFHFRLVDPVRRIYHFKAKNKAYNVALRDHQLSPQRIAFDPDKDVFSHDIPPQAD